LAQIDGLPHIMHHSTLFQAHDSASADPLLSSKINFKHLFPPYYWNYWRQINL